MYSSFMQYGEVFLTGGTGRLGAPVCEALLRNGFLPRMLVRPGSEGRIRPDLRPRCRVTLGNLVLPESVEMGMQGTMAVVHLAAAWKEGPRGGLSPVEFAVRAASNLLSAAAGWRIDRVIHVSAAGAHPGAPSPFLDACGRAEERVRGSDRAWTVFRPRPWYGPRDGKPLLSGEYLADLADGIAAAIRREDTVGRVIESPAGDRFAAEPVRDAGDPVVPA